MNAPARIKPPARDAYIPQVQTFMHGCEGEELSLRCSLLMMRDRALSHQRSASPDAAAVLALVEGIARGNAFKSMRLDALRELRAQLVLLTACASGFEMVAHVQRGDQ